METNVQWQGVSPNDAKRVLCPVLFVEQIKVKV